MQQFILFIIVFVCLSLNVSAQQRIRADTSARPNIIFIFIDDMGYGDLSAFGKWHMGGGRDVADAPLPQAYGFEESLVSFEGLGDRLLIKGQGLSEASAKLEQGNITWVAKHEMTPICSMAHVAPPSVDFDGEDMGKALLGETQKRTQPLYWEYGRTGFYLKPGNPRFISPNLAMRDDQWKLLINADSTQAEIEYLSYTARFRLTGWNDKKTVS